MQEHNFQGVWIKGDDFTYGNDDAGYYQDHRNTILKRTFQIEEVKPCTLYVATLGYSIGYINGHRIGEDELNCDWTNFTKRVYYDSYDITKYIYEGENELIFELGNGMYNPAPLQLFGKYNLRKNLSEIGTPCLLCDVEVAGTLCLCSDDKWLAKEGNVLFNNVYLGEFVDMHEVSKPWYPVTCDTTQRPLVKSEIPKIKKFQHIHVHDMQEIEDGILCDFKEMISGFLHVTMYAEDKQEISMQYCERCMNGKPDFTSSLAGSVGEWMGDFQIPGGPGAPQQAIQSDRILCKKGKNTFENKFTYHSFRYVYLKGCRKEDIEDMYAIYVHSDVSKIADVQTDHSFLNDLYDAATRTKYNNMHSIFEDCARERLGYGGDIVALAISNLYTFDVESFYKKIIIDFRLEQTTAGGIPETAPYMGIQSNGTAPKEGPLLWQLVYAYVTYKHYQFYGDIDFVLQEYPYIEKQMKYLLSYDIDELAHCCLGDHGSILIAGYFRKPTPDKLFIGYCTILLFLTYNIRLAQILHKDVQMYQQKYEEIKTIILDKFLHKDGSFGDATQSGYAFAIALGLADEKELCEQFVKKIKQDEYVFNSGIFGMMLSYEVLNKYGYDDVIEKWLLKDGAISFKKMLASGNKALAELFVGDHYSLNHAMFASYQQWYYQGLAGIQICEDACAFDKVKVKPYFSKQINQVSCHITTKQGSITSSWKRDGDTIVWKLKLPKTISYTILPQLDYDIEKRYMEQDEHVYVYKSK